jgi:hypothetical protein
MAEQQTPQQPAQTPPPPSESQKKTLKIVLIVVGVLAVLGIIGSMLLAYFGARIGEEIIENATGTNIERSGDSVRIESEDGTAELNATSLPDDFPDVVPIFEPNSIMSVSSFSTGEGKSWNVTLSTNASPSEVQSFYQSEFSQNGWSVETSTDTGDTKGFIALNEAENMRISMNAGRESGDEETMIILTVVSLEE